MGIFSVLVDAPAHSGLTGTLDYTSETELQAGQLVRVPLGHREVLGVVWDSSPTGDLAPEALRAAQVLSADLPPLNAAWRGLVQFAAQYYQRTPGEVALHALPPELRRLQAQQLARRLKKGLTPAKAVSEAPKPSVPLPTPEQAQVLASGGVEPDMQGRSLYKEQELAEMEGMNAKV